MQIDLQIVLETGSDSEYEELEESDVEDGEVSTVGPVSRIGQILQPESDFSLIENSQDEDENAKEEVDADNITNERDSKCSIINFSMYSKHVPNWVFPAGHIQYLGDEFSLPHDDIDTWTPLTHFKSSWKDELNELLSEQTIIMIVVMIIVIIAIIVITFILY